MKKTLSLLLALFAAALLCIGCTKEETPSAPAYEPTVLEVVENLSKTVTIPQMTTIDDEETILTMYDLDTGMIAEMAMLKAGSGVNADEVMVIKLKDAANAETVRQALTLRVTVLGELFVDYTPEDMPKIENAAIETSGLYLMLAVCDDPDAAVEAFTSSMTAK